MRKILTSIIAIATFFSCSESETIKTGGFTDEASTLFSKIDAKNVGINFRNDIKETLEFNILTYPYLYSGGGIAVGDIDNDGFEDLYFSSNFGPNKLYRNKGDFTFEDITRSSGTSDVEGFKTGVTMLDVNNDGWLDIYVCKAGSLNNKEARRNKLFINQQNGTFQEASTQWGIDDPGYTTQVYPFDYDRDGDLDLYVLNYRYDFKNNGKISSDIQRQIEEETSDQL